MYFVGDWEIEMNVAPLLWTTLGLPPEEKGMLALRWDLLPCYLTSKLGSVTYVLWDLEQII